eukprot:TRINITY_DN30484_c0_g1_i1.p1 TRINITY_DN30484_c0_g1~~TRINITY_DN30484_c0_g1_i1.p1  ORF type:complete len:568 (+),score=145.83 TRINITY_DN30484_c0_g1_i1:91-1794(+)
MDLSTMTEEEQLEAAMRMSMEQSAPAAAGGDWQPGVDEDEDLRRALAQSLASAPPPPPPSAPPPASAAPAPAPTGAVASGAASAAPAAERSFSSKDPGDVLPAPGKAQSPTASAPAGEAFELDASSVATLMAALFCYAPDPSDVARWFGVGFRFAEAAGAPAWGLWQTQGGPCGVFAPLQAYMLRSLLFGDACAGDADDRSERLQSADAGERLDALVHALATVLFQSTPLSSYSLCEVEPVSGVAQTAPAIRGHRFGNIVAVRDFLRTAMLDDRSWLSGSCGVLSFLCSVLQTRSLEALRGDMDDPSNPLIGRFGHCSQELVNLMLIGEGTSNVFDGVRWLGDDPSSGFQLKGVDGSRLGTPAIGYLSELEPMQYVSVGSLYKHPEFPIWVLGSPTHYTVLFSAVKANAALSQEARLEQRARQAFAAHSGLDEGTGLAMATSLDNMLTELAVPRERWEEARQELVREDVFLWGEFWGFIHRVLGPADAGNIASAAASLRTLRLYHYDGQDPPGPTLRSMSVELTDVDPAMAGGGADDSFSATLHTRWPNAAISLLPQGANGESAVAV